MQEGILKLAKERHEDILADCYKWLKPGGHLLMTVAKDDEAPYTEDFFGTTMFRSNYGVADYLKMVRDLGFQVLENTVINHGYEGEDFQEETYPVIFAQKR